MELLGHVVILCLALKATDALLSAMSVPPQRSVGFRVLCLLTAASSRPPRRWLPGDGKSYLLGVLVCVFLRTVFARLSMGLLTTCVSSLGKILFKSSAPSVECLFCFGVIAVSVSILTISLAGYICKKESLSFSG